ncbi:PH domain-containing protein [Luteococcus sp. H138]|uniref:PH domain-containing protein n=1 Tax=unclassified Luteococcus TaxID=2639923 RepID=UPI00313D809B
MMGSVMSIVLLVFSFGLWFALGPELRALFTMPQILTLLFFLAVMIGMMMSVGMSTIVVTDQGLMVRNALWTRRFPWSEVVGVHMGGGDPWAYIRLAPTLEHPEGRTQLALAIQRSEGAMAEERIAQLQALIARHRP